MFYEESWNVPRLLDSFLIALLCHGLAVRLRNHGKRIAFLQELSPNRGDFFSSVNSRHGDGTAVSRTNRDPADVCLPLAGQLLGNDHSELSRFTRIRDNSAQRN